MELFRETHINFLKYKWWAIGASWLLIAIGLFAIFVQKGLKFGIDFAGGTQIAVRFVQTPDLDRIRKILDAANLGDTGIQRYEEPEKNEVLIRVQQQRQEGRDVSHDVQNALRAGLLGPAEDPSRLDLNREGKDNLTARLVAADPDLTRARLALTGGPISSDQSCGYTRMGIGFRRRNEPPAGTATTKEQADMTVMLSIRADLRPRRSA